jgi:hypothetical protein
MTMIVRGSKIGNYWINQSNKKPTSKRNRLVSHTQNYNKIKKPGVPLKPLGIGYIEIKNILSFFAAKVGNFADIKQEKTKN